MLGHQFAFSQAPIKKVKEVQFGILSPEEIVSLSSLLVRSAPLIVIHRKPTPWPKSSIRRSWTNRPTRQRWEGLWTPEWALLTGISSVRPVVRGCRSVRGILVILSWLDQSFIQVSHSLLNHGWRSIFRKGFIVKVKKILESICVNCGKLKADMVRR